jgi:glutamine amidotransferase
MGLQVLMDFSEENAGTPLLGLVPGEVRRFPSNMRVQGAPLKIPHMGWNRVAQVRPHPLWEDIPDGSRFYFVHSYFVVPRDPDLAAGTTDYGVTFTSVLARDNLFAMQFHPEKSSDHGLQLLRNFARWRP